MEYKKLCDMSCEKCGFSSTSPVQMSKTLANYKIPFVLDLDVFEKNCLTKYINDIPNSVILKKVSNKLIDFGIFKTVPIERVIYHIDFNDLLIPEELERIKFNFNIIILNNVFLRIYVFVKNKSDFIETMEILKEYNNCSINFYCDKYFNFDNYPQLDISGIDKVKISDLFDKRYCNHKIIKDYDVIYDYKQLDYEQKQKRA